MNRLLQRRFEEINLGDTLSTLTVPVTTASIIASSIAARDFFALHQDPEVARQQGHPHIFLSGVASIGLVQRFVTDWAGIGAQVRAINTRLGVAHYAGDTLVLSGSVTGRAQDASRWVEVTVTGDNSLGQHLQSVVRLELRPV